MSVASMPLNLVFSGIIVAPACKSPSMAITHSAQLYIQIATRSAVSSTPEATSAAANERDRSKSSA